MTPLLVLLGTIAGAWYLLIVRPQKDQQTRHGRLVERLQVGDHVLTVGGIYGRVLEVDQATVVLELAPGLTSRIATDGIARIVHGAEAALPIHATRDGAPTPSNPPQAMEDHMHQHPDPHQHQHPAPAQHAPAQTMPQQQYAAPTHVQYAAPPMLPPPPAPGMTTVRAQVAPTFEPRPWGDVPPRVAQHAPQAQHPEMYAQPVLQQPYQQAQVAYVPPPQPPYAQPTLTQPAAPAPMPVHVPFAATAPVQYQQPSHPHATQTMPVAHHAAPAPVHLQHAHVAQHQHAPVEQAPEAPGARRISRAPKGMGSSLRLDDPSLRDTIARAREERSDLVVEYRRLSAPLVDVDVPVPGMPAGDVAAPQLVGHDPTGVPLFATPGVPGVHPLDQYPSPARIVSEQPHGVPRPIMHGASVPIDPAMQSTAFQRPTPYAPVRPEPPPPAPQQVHAHS